jgi:hypothetical protein
VTSCGERDMDVAPDRFPLTHYIMAAIGFVDFEHVFGELCP